MSVFRSMGLPAALLAATGGVALVTWRYLSARGHKSAEKGEVQEGEESVEVVSSQKGEIPDTSRTGDQPEGAEQVLRAGEATVQKVEDRTGSQGCDKNVPPGTTPVCEEESAGKKSAAAAVTSVVQKEKKIEVAAVTSVIQKEKKIAAAAVTSVIPEEEKSAAAPVTSVIPEEKKIAAAAVTSVIPEEKKIPAAPVTSVIPEEKSAIAPVTSVMQDEKKIAAAAVTSVMQDEKKSAAAAVTSVIPEEKSAAAAVTSVIPEEKSAAVTSVIPEEKSAAAPVTSVMQDEKKIASAPVTSVIPEEKSVAAAVTSVIPEEKSAAAPVTSVIPEERSAAAPVTSVMQDEKKIASAPVTSVIPEKSVAAPVTSVMQDEKKSAAAPVQTKEEAPKSLKSPVEKGFTGSVSSSEIKHKEKHAPCRQVLVLGLDGSGKTSILNSIAANKGKVITTPTEGVNAMCISNGNSKMEFLEIGGSEQLRPYWKMYLSRAFAVIFVVDSADHGRLQLAKSHLHQLIQQDSVLPLIVLANKQDLQNAHHIPEIHDALALSEICEDRKLYLIGTYVANDGSEVSSGIQDTKEFLAQLLLENC
ncbi:ADP-ribosylation factor-like protein 9 isoform X1 [Phyllobates terribilis]|uniref:ADP-ribosylation factor-like protein 9 isoform X1 n=1 Tax=Phyllobates terribilis TaxID=111132 RepID=UPI003CCA9900